MNLTRLAPTALLAAAAVAVVGAGVTGGHDHTHTAALDEDVAAVAGFTKVAFTDRWLVVVNVLPAEPMYSPDEVAHDHPTWGEMAIEGEGSPTGPGVRHVEAHVYDRTTGLPVDRPVPALEVLVHATGERLPIPAVLMQDVNIGEADLHFGDNVALPGDTDLTVTVTIADEEVSLDGHLD
ncbi:MAG: hypothetical protein D6683_03580 [Actinomyces sp.]|nr:MAG: hypothetical protein D6683_03580 [Actinomyces sp.]